MTVSMTTRCSGFLPLVLGGVLILGMLLPVSAAADDPYSALGEGRGRSEQEADAAAVQAALTRIIPQAGLREIFVDEWYSSLEIQERKLVRKNKREAVVRVVLRVNPVTLNQAEQKWESIVIRKLNQAEALLAEMDKKIEKGEKSEENGRVEEAYVAYRQAEAKGGEARALLQSFSEASFQSDQGYNRRAVLDRLKSQQTAVVQGLQRLDRYSENAVRDEQARQRRQLFQELRSRQAGIEAFIGKMAAHSPFRTPSRRDELEGWLLDVQGNLDMIRDRLEPQYRELEKAAGEDSFLFLRKISLAEQELKSQEEKLEKYRRELKTEIRTPYIVRRERARRRAQFWGGVGEFFFTHESKDRVALRYTLPVVGVFPRKFPVHYRSPLDFRLRLEGSLKGLWLRSSTARETLDGFNGGKNTAALEQQVALGLGDERVKGVGFGWDWAFWEHGSGRLPARYRAAVFLVGQNEEKERADWVLSLQYQLPQPGGEFLPAYYLNGEGNVLARLGDHLVFEGGARSFCLESPRSEWEGKGPYAEDLQYWRDGYIGVGVRFPGPFLWQLRYVNEASGALAGTGIGALTVRNVWEVQVEYSF